MNFFSCNKVNGTVQYAAGLSSRVRSLALIVFVLPLVSGCQKSSEQLPPNSSVIVNPSEITWEIANNGGVCNYDPNVYQDHTISIMVVNESNNYIPDAPLTVSLDLAGNTFSGIPVLALYDDKNGNGLADDPSELVSDNTDEIYDTNTDSVTGHKYLILRVNLSCTYRGTLSAFSDGYMGTTTITVKEQQL